VTATAAIRPRPFSTRVTSSFSTAAASAQVRAMSCSTTPPGRLSYAFGRSAEATARPSIVKATALTIDVPASRPTMTSPLMPPAAS
jgi:hypothetical protein